MTTAISVLDKKLPTPNCFVAHFKNVAIFVWLGRADGETMAKVTKFADQLLVEYPRLSLLHVVGRNMGLPTREGRERIVAAARKNKQKIACIGVLVPHSGFYMRMLLTFLQALRTLLGGDTRTVVDRDAQALVRRFVAAHASQTSVAILADDLAQAIEEARLAAASAR